MNWVFLTATPQKGCCTKLFLQTQFSITYCMLDFDIVISASDISGYQHQYEPVRSVRCCVLVF